MVLAPWLWGRSAECGADLSTFGDDTAAGRSPVAPFGRDGTPLREGLDAAVAGLFLLLASVTVILGILLWRGAGIWPRSADAQPSPLRQILPERRPASTKRLSATGNASARRHWCKTAYMAKVPHQANVHTLKPSDYFITHIGHRSAAL